jgi:cyclophilin family peptidyl-prolyl cis-trans isomerase
MAGADELKYALLDEVNGRWMADIIEAYMRAEEIDVVLIQDAISQVTHTNPFAPVQIFVPKTSLKRARNLLKLYYESQNNAKDEANMANKKKIEQRVKVLKAQQTERTVRMVGIGVLVLIGLALAYLGITNLQGSAPDAPESGLKQYDAPPPMTIDTSKTYTATFKMENGGEFTVRLFADKAPVTVNNFVFLARDGYYDGVTFHRVIDGFMAQGGDPTGTGSGGPGYEFPNEDNDLTFDKAGVVAMANAGRDTNGSQFFITFGPNPELNGGYTIFGQVIEGMEAVNGITRRDPNQAPDFPGDAIETITITEE